MSTNNPGSPQAQRGEIPPPPVFSSDGKFWWDGQRWTPTRGLTHKHDIANGVVGGLFKFIGFLLLIPIAIYVVAAVLNAVLTLVGLGGNPAAAFVPAIVGLGAFVLWRRRRTGFPGA